MAHQRMSDSAPLYALIILIVGFSALCAAIYFVVTL